MTKGDSFRHSDFVIPSSFVIRASSFPRCPVLTSLYVMEFEPGGTNFPHHHDAEEEIYLLLDGKGEMVAGSGTNGLEARFPATPGDAYFFRLNCTVGFYNSAQGPAHILAVRSLFPRRVAGR